MRSSRAKVCKGMFLAVLVLVLTTGQAVQGADKKNKDTDEPKGPAPVVGGVTILPDKKGLEVSGKVVMQQGILDFLAVITGGREYESVLALDVKPSMLHASLIAIGAKSGPTPSYIEWKTKQDTEAGKKDVKPLEPGSSLQLTLVWKTPDGKTHEVPAVSFLYNRRTKQVEPQTNPWIFTGGYFGKSIEGKTIYVADEDGAVISVVPESSAVINLAVSAGNPYDSPDEGFMPNKDVVPPRDTPVVLRISLIPVETKTESKDAQK